MCTYEAYTLRRKESPRIASKPANPAFGSRERYWKVLKQAVMFCIFPLSLTSFVLIVVKSSGCTGKSCPLISRTMMSIVDQPKDDVILLTQNRM